MHILRKLIWQPALGEDPQNREMQDRTAGRGYGGGGATYFRALEGRKKRERSQERNEIL